MAFKGYAALAEVEAFEVVKMMARSILIRSYRLVRVIALVLRP